MSEKPDDATPRILVDDDWKTEAAREKAKLADETKDVGAPGALPTPKFAELVNMIAMQAVVGLGGMTTPDGQHIPPELDLAKHHIDMLSVLEDKTKGNLDEEETKMITESLSELRQNFVMLMEQVKEQQMKSGQAGVTNPDAGGEGSGAGGGIIDPSA